MEPQASVRGNLRAGPVALMENRQGGRGVRAM